jgi:hypothetical protein
MKKQYTYLLLLIPIILFAGLDIQQVNSVLSAIKLKDKSPSYYTTDKSFLTKLKVPKSKSIQNADILLFPENRDVKKILIVDNYDKLQKNQKSIGAIYMKKGRTQIIFVDERLKAKGIRLSRKYRKYIMRECYLKELCFLN